MKPEVRTEFTEDSEPEGSQTLEGLLVPLWRSRGWILLALVLGLAGGAFYGAIQPNTYQSYGKLLTAAGTREQGSTEARVVGERPDVISTREMVANELHLLSNPIVFENVVRRVGVDRILDAYDPAHGREPAGGLTGWMHRFQGWWFERSSRAGAAGSARSPEARVVLATHALKGAIALRNEPGSSVITVLCTTHSPELSADLVNAFIEEALAQHQAVFSSRSALSFLDERVEEALSATQRADEALANYRITCGFYDAESQRQQLLVDINALERELAQSRAQMAAFEAKEALVRSEFDREPLVHRLTADRPLDRNPERMRIQQRILQLRDELLVVESRRDLTPQQREAQASVIGQQIAAAQEELERQPEFLSGGERMEEVLNPRYQRLREQLDQVREDQVSIATSAERIEGRLLHLRERLSGLERCRPQLQALESAAAQSSQRLTQFQHARERVAVMNLLDNVNLINLRPLQAGNVPLSKSGPRRGRLVAIGGLLGLLAGMGWALARARLDRQVRTLDDVERQLGVPILGVVPHLDDRDLRAGGRAPSSDRKRA